MSQHNRTSGTNKEVQLPIPSIEIIYSPILALCFMQSHFAARLVYTPTVASSIHRPSDCQEFEVTVGFEVL